MSVNAARCDPSDSNVNVIYTHGLTAITKACHCTLLAKRCRTLNFQWFSCRSVWDPRGLQVSAERVLMEPGNRCAEAFYHHVGTICQSFLCGSVNWNWHNTNCSQLDQLDSHDRIVLCLYFRVGKYIKYPTNNLESSCSDPKGKILTTWPFYLEWALALRKPSTSRLQ